MPVNSKNKGSNFERTIAKDFTKWWNDAGYFKGKGRSRVSSTSTLSWN